MTNALCETEKERMCLLSSDGVLRFFRLKLVSPSNLCLATRCGAMGELIEMIGE